MRLPGDSKLYRDRFLKSCEKLGIPTEIISSTKALELVPNLNPEIEEAVKCPTAPSILSVCACSTSSPRRKETA